MVLVSHDRKLTERLATRAMIPEDGTLKPAVMHSHPHQHHHSHLHIHAASLGTDHQHQHAVPEHSVDHNR